MTAYNATHDLVAYQAQLDNDARAVAAWDEQCSRQRDAYDSAYAAWEGAYAEWETNPTDVDGNPIVPPVAPDEPTYPTEPQATATPPPVYTSEPIDEPQLLDTQSGTVIVTPPSVLMTGESGETFALLPGDLDAAWVEVT